MALFGEVIGLSDELMIKTLASDKDDAKLDAAPVSIASGEPESIDVSDEELELSYRKEPQVFHSINLKVQMIMGAGRELRVDKDIEDGKVLNFFRDFLDNVGEIGGEETEEEILEKIFQNELMHGKHFIETVYNKKETRIVDLTTQDPKQFDYARNNRKAIVFDDIGKPIGFTQQLPPNIDTSGKGDLVPDNVDLKNNQIFLLPHRIAFFKLYTYGDGLNPLGVIEPGYKSIVRKQNIEEAQTNSIYARGTFPIIDYVGTPERFPTPKMLANATRKLAQMQHNRYFAFPYWHRIEPLEVKQSDIVENTVKNLREEITASVGMPLAFSMGTGEATNRATLNNQQKMLEFSLNDVVKKTIATFRKQIFRRISRLMDFRDEDGKLIIPYYVWGDVGAEDKDAKAQRLTNYLKNGGITPEYVMPFVIKSEDLILDKDLIIPQKNFKKEKPPKEEEGKNLSAKKTNYSFEDLEKAIRS